MDNLIFKRRSIRKYTGEIVDDETIKHLLKAAMAAPSARNLKPWEFYVFRDKNIVESFVQVHPHAAMLREASAAILVCGNQKVQPEEGYLIVDCSAATENFLLEANNLGLGTCWIGVYPRLDRIDCLRKELSLPDEIMPIALISIGYPAEEKAPHEEYYPDKVHFISGK